MCEASQPVVESPEIMLACEGIVTMMESRKHDIVALQDVLALESRQSLRKGRPAAGSRLEDFSFTLSSLDALIVENGIFLPIRKEHKRLKALHELDILDESGFPELDRSTAMAARIFNVDNAAVALVDLRRIWCPSIAGQQQQQQPGGREFGRGNSITSIAIARASTSEAFVVVDASVDDRVAHLDCVKRKGGIRFYAGVPLIGPNRQCIGMFSICSAQARDEQGLSLDEVQTLSDLAATAMSFITSRRRLQAVKEERTQTVTSLAHDLMTPLTGIQLASQLLTSDDELIMKLNLKQKESLEAVSTSVVVMERFCKAALHFLRQHESTTNLEQQQEDSESDADMGLDDLITELQTMIRCFPKQVPVIFHIDPLVPCLLQGGIKIQQAALNLLSIACTRTVQGTVTFRVRTDGQRVVFECTDTAPHLSKADAERVMLFHDPRYFEDELLAQYAFPFEGSYQVALDFKNGMRRNASGQGSTFWFSVPQITSERSLRSTCRCVQLSEEDDSESPLLSALSPESPLVNTGRTALVVDDCSVVRKVLSRSLGKIGYKVDVAEDGQEGLSKLMRCTYDVCLCDFLMPILDGMDMVRQYRHWELVHRGSYRQNIVGMSAHAADSDSSKAIDSGMDSFMSKPISIATLNAMASCESTKRNLRDEDEREDVYCVCADADDDSSMLHGSPEGKRNRVSLNNDDAGSLLTNTNVCNMIEESSDQMTTTTTTTTAHSHYGCLLVSKTPIEDCLCNTKAAFCQAGWDFSHATTRDEAIQYLQARNWDVVLVNGNISPMSGIDIIADFRNWESNNRFNRQNNVLFTTTLSSSSNSGAVVVDDDSMITPCGFDGCVRIPLSNMNSLVDVIASLTREKKSPMSIISH